MNLKVSRMPDNKRLELCSSAGLKVAFLDSGLIERIDAGPIRVSLNAASPLGKLGVNLYLRKKKAPSEYTLLLGPQSNSLFAIADNCFVAEGSWDNLNYTCKLRLSEESLGWQWTIDIYNASNSAVELDLIYVQDAGLVPSADGRANEYYVSQYLERRVLTDPHYGSVICCRQNIKGPTGNPYLMLASKNPALAASVDGMQFYGNTFRTTGIPEGVLAAELTGEYSGEMSILALQETPFTLAANASHRSTYVASYLPDHPRATTDKDLERLPGVVQEFRSEPDSPVSLDLLSPAQNKICASPHFPVDHLSAEELEQFFGTKRRHIEKEEGRLLSFFCGSNNHVVLRAKETVVDRPHAHIMQTSAAFVPNENIMMTTSYMYGVFNSHIAQGNSNFNRLLSVSSSQFNLATETGQRILVEVDGQQYLLGVPSAFEMGLSHCRWIYAYGEHCFQVRTWASKKVAQINLDFKVLRGGSVNILISHQFDKDNAWTISREKPIDEIVARPGADSVIAEKFPQAQFRIIVRGGSNEYSVSGDEALYVDGQSRGDSFLVVGVNDASEFCMSFVGEVASKTDAIRFDNTDEQWEADCLDAQSVWQDLCSDLLLKSDQIDVAVLQETLPWYGVNALTHFLTPHGLEQVDGAAWGTRDTNQGPLELLLATRKFEDARQVLRIVFSNQNVDGGWPQWWMFDSYSSIRADDCHGDIFHWCIVALSNYIETTGDAAFLDDLLPYYYEDGVEAGQKTPLSEHVDRLIDMITASFLPGTALVPFDGGDWNDSMQPVDRDLASRMISPWTVELNYQAFNAYQKVCTQIGRSDQAARLKAICSNIKADFNKYLVRDETVSGLGLLENDGTVSLLLHPSDSKTNIQYRLLPMIRGIISGIFTPGQAQHHLILIEKHLKGPDGARLMNRAPKYNGGIQTIFRRAESSPYFGREIGLMYMHAHLRYAESLAIAGRPDAFLKALRQATPVAYKDIVPCGDVRQANCYYSSSDVTFKNRYEAEEKYEDLKAGKIALRGGWRIYSSGPGIFIGLVFSRLLGLRESFGNMIIDPVIPHHLDGMSASMQLMGRHITIIYTVCAKGFGAKSISINDKTIEFTREENRYRMGGALIPADRFLAMLNRDENTVRVSIF